MKKILQTVFVLMLTTAMAWGQDQLPWSLEKCIDQAIQYNLQMKRQELLTQSTEQDHRQSKLDLLPNLNGSIDHQLGTGRVLDRGTYQWVNTNVSQGTLGMQSEVNLFNGLQGMNSMKMNRANYQMSMEDLEAMEDNITIEVITGYLDLLRNRELVEVAEVAVEVTQQQVERMERLVEVGNEPKGRLLEVRAQLSAAKLTLTQAVNSRDITKLNLMHVMNISDERGFDIETPVLPDPTSVEIPDLDSVFGYAQDNLPQIKSKEYGIEAMERWVALQKGQRSPRLFARGLIYSNYSDQLVNPLDPDPSNPTMDYPTGEQINDNRYMQASMGLSIPIFNRWRVQTDIKKAKLDLQDAEYQYDDAMLILRQTLQQYHTEALAAMSNYNSAVEAVANSDEAFRFADERFRVGTGTALELQEARNQLVESTAQMISSKYVLIFYTRILNFYMGRDILF
jgi:outer membrane protein